MNKLAKLAEQESQLADKIKFRNFKQHHVEKLAESFKPINRKESETKETNKKISLSEPKNETSTKLAIYNVQPATEKTQNLSPSGVISDTSSENTKDSIRKNIFSGKKPLKHPQETYSGKVSKLED